ncbi:MBL fold metallo-hydrolase [Arthrobacter sp. FW306-07-I]|uniref:MBL fold metallo-hydrolase n=1 Tax=Arthrobacter sp. FW306-07-I TaxID=2879622 RepID=UPI001F44F100|nr:MBL fold metallo-hydrolase [Arthrobacter sp. FW306-07-I]UKA76167.1 MBL fold metallo-hydrolase [Arthrobacter sp. FW306-07-I]
MLASFGLGAAAVTLTACTPTSGSAGATASARKFGPAAADGHRTRLVLLGTSGGPPYWPGGTREGISSALVVGDRYYLIDAGHGVMRQLRAAKLGPNFDKDLDGPLDVLAGIFLTHLHSDHVVDLNNILSEGLYNGLQTVKKIPIWGPGNRGQVPALFGSGVAPEPVSPGNPTPGTKEMTDLIVQAYATDFNDRLFDNRKPRPEQLWEAHDVPVPAQYLKSPNTQPCPEMDPFTFYEDDHVKVSATLVNHAPVFPALAYRFDTADGSVVFSGDTGKNPNLVKLAKNTDALVHEVIDKAWPESLFPTPRTPAQEGLYEHLVKAHTLIEDVGPVAQEARAKTLVLSHLVPGNRPDEVWADCGKGFDGQLVIGHDLDVIGIGTATA